MVVYIHFFFYQDFVRLPWQNQSGQNSNAGPVGPTASSGSGILSRGYGSASGQLNPSMYSSGLGSTGIGAVAQSLDFVPEETESNLAKLHRCFFSLCFWAFNFGPCS